MKTVKVIKENKYYILNDNYMLYFKSTLCDWHVKKIYYPFF